MFRIGDGDWNLRKIRVMDYRGYLFRGRLEIGGGWVLVVLMVCGRGLMSLSKGYEKE